jgi:hypothetical protein
MVPISKETKLFFIFKTQIQVHNTNLGIYYVNSYCVTSNFCYYLPHLYNLDINVYTVYNVHTVLGVY